MSSITENPIDRWRHWVGSAVLLMMALPVLTGCSTQPPTGVAVVTPFDVQRYEGKWYEIARLDHRFERGLTDINATYRRQADGSVQVINRGYDAEDREWDQAVGKAFFTGAPNMGSLKVSFFGPFYGGYHVVALDKDYRWSMVMGPDRDYFWILARDKQLPEELLRSLLLRARQLGIATDKLIWTPQQRADG